MADAASTARSMWTLFEPIHAMTYFAPEARSAFAALPVPEREASGSSALARLWQAATVLREHRGDGHFAALAAADIDGCEAVALRCCLDLRREDLQPVRGWTDEAWDDALSRLAARVLPYPSPIGVPAPGREVREP